MAWASAVVALLAICAPLGCNSRALRRAGYVCEVCGTARQRATVLDVCVGWVPDADAGSSLAQAYNAWWNATLALEHEHAWFLTTCPSVSFRLARGREPYAALLLDTSGTNEDVISIATVLANRAGARRARLVEALGVRLSGTSGLRRQGDPRQRLMLLRESSTAWDEALAELDPTADAMR